MKKMLPRLWDLCLSALVFAGLLAVSFVVLSVLFSDVLHLRDLRLVLPHNVFVWGMTALMVVFWILPVMFAHKRIMKRLRARRAAKDISE